MAFVLTGQVDAASQTAVLAGANPKNAGGKSGRRASANRFQPIDQILTRIGSLTDFPTAA